MLYVIITIATISIILFVSSFFMSNRFANLEDLVEQQSITFSQDLFALKRKVSDLDERIQTNAYVINSTGLADKTPLVTQKVYHLHQQGMTFEDIAKRTDLTVYEIQLIIEKK